MSSLCCPTCGQNVASDLGMRIRAIRKTLSYSQSEMAEKIGLTRVGYRGVEGPKSNPRLATLILIGKVANLTVDEILQYPYKESPNDK